MYTILSNSNVDNVKKEKEKGVGEGVIRNGTKTYTSISGEDQN